jgi:hypothetical protein
MSMYIVIEYIDWEGSYVSGDDIQAYATREAAIEAEVPKSYRKTLRSNGGGWDVIEVKEPKMVWYAGPPA